MLWSVPSLSVLCRECRATKLLFALSPQNSQLGDSLSSPLLLLLQPHQENFGDRLRELFRAWPQHTQGNTELNPPLFLAAPGMCLLFVIPSPPTVGC